MDWQRALHYSSGEHGYELSPAGSNAITSLPPLQVNKEAVEQHAELTKWKAQLQALDKEVASRAQEVAQERSKLASERRSLEVLQQQVRAQPGHMQRHWQLCRQGHQHWTSDTLADGCIACCWLYVCL